MNYTKEQLNARMAEVYTGESYRCAERRITMDWMKAHDWQPTEDANQALMVLEKWCDDTCNRSKIYFDETDSEVCLIESVDRGDGSYDDDLVCSILNKSLPTAICLAVASAEDGQQATLEEV